MTTQLSQAVVHLREMILRGELGPGQRVAEAPLAEALGMSRTPVRQALPLLAQEGLLIEHVTRGYVVRGFTPADIVDAIELRGTLEGLAARRVAERGLSKALLRTLRDCLEDGDTLLAKRHLVAADEAAYGDMNARFHDALIREADSPVLSEALARVSRVPFAGSQAIAFDRSDLERMYDLFRYAHRQHHAIVEALAAGEGARVEALMREHANTVKESINIAALHLLGADPRIALTR